MRNVPKWVLKMMKNPLKLWVQELITKAVEGEFSANLAKRLKVSDAVVDAVLMEIYRRVSEEIDRL